MSPFLRMFWLKSQCCEKFSDCIWSLYAWVHFWLIYMHVCMFKWKTSWWIRGGRQLCEKVCRLWAHPSLLETWGKQRGLSACELQWESAYHFKNNYHSARQLQFLSGNVCVCSSETSGQRLHCFKEEKRERKKRDSQQGLLAVWDWE